MWNESQRISLPPLIRRIYAAVAHGVDSLRNVNCMTSIDIACHFSEPTRSIEADMHYPKLPNIARIAVSRREAHGLDRFPCRRERMSLLDVKSDLE